MSEKLPQNLFGTITICGETAKYSASDANEAFKANGWSLRLFLTDPQNGEPLDRGSSEMTNGFWSKINPIPTTNGSFDLEEEFAGWEALSDEAFDKFEKSLA
ncbi:MAG: hypothetical protein H6668_16740 [Ardenticatenaceae bacterium]|nr:hypothetical protein [Ardenticatenaceae bacterium]